MKPHVCPKCKTTYLDSQHPPFGIDGSKRSDVYRKGCGNFYTRHVHWRRKRLYDCR